MGKQKQPTGHETHQDPPGAGHSAIRTELNLNGPPPQQNVLFGFGPLLLVYAIPCSALALMGTVEKSCSGVDAYGFVASSG